ncbi:ATPase subunit of ABC transporter with duplicated ATPase domains [Arthrobacter silviterrae]|uniref:ABC-F family ATP-binding cassette domain-containing protein n=1 Tax=Arthrobacter silviterrae TaxID=2026658 RepID=A0ABX0D9P0_9MICC|nr:ABC-F family ATP-binding cassette domain-containing protein [Arthrobacter silviterrae]MDQ0278548.1 ATPase subunit of ABC transporter with duplicated ATPase domains [Arthrobacter silviterrae]NGN82195.1 ABC-F family ATP-binding cassette domain-containing protein [Arthrobacter silviterrae]
MTATLVAKDLSGGHAHRTLFSNLSFTVAPGDVVGVVGANGAGKSTLLSLLAGADTPQGGTVSTAPQDAFVGWLPQEHERVDGETVAGYLGRRTGCTQATQEMESSAGELGTDSAADDRYASALDHWLACGAADLDERIPATLAELGLDVGPDALMTGLSGGQAARVALAALLLSRFDVVLLDEPTNDLDLAGLARLEEFVKGLRGGVVLVSHDREFLSRCVTTVVELDLAQNKVAVYDGGYDAFLEERAIAKRHAREAYDEFAEKKADLVGRARVQREWSSQGVRNAMKKSPDNDKIRRRAASESSEKQAQKVRQMESRIARLDEVEEPRKEWALQFSIGAAPRSSTVVATLNAAVVRQGSFTLGPVSLQVNAGERIGITGPNGAGKSTLLGLLLGRTAQDSGVASLGANVAIGEIDQARGQFPEGVPLGSAFEALVPEMNQGEVRTLLAKFGLKADQVTSPVGALSPGERTRASLALLQARGVNVLVLDEPTNHLDLPAIEQLEEALDRYEGTLLLVSHDRRLLENVRLDIRWDVSNGRVTEL